MTEQDASGAAPAAVIGLSPGRNIVAVGAGVTVAATDRLALFAGYDVNISPGNSIVQSVSAGARIKF